MPRILEPVTVVKTPEVDITEYAGNGSSGQACISIANVKAEGGWAEPWQTPEFDEWVLVTKGKVHIEHSHGDVVEVVAGKAVYLAKGERVRWVFPEGGCEYVRALRRETRQSSRKNGRSSVPSGVVSDRRLDYRTGTLSARAVVALAPPSLVRPPVKRARLLGSGLASPIPPGGSRPACLTWSRTSPDDHLP